MSKNNLSSSAKSNVCHVLCVYINWPLIIVIYIWISLSGSVTTSWGSDMICFDTNSPPLLPEWPPYYCVHVPPPHPILHPFKIYLMSLINYCCWSNVDMKGSSLSFFEHDMFRVKVLINPSADNLQLFDLSCHFLWYRSEKERSHLSRERLSLDKTENAFLPGFSPSNIFVWVLRRKPVQGGPKNANVQRPWERKDLRHWRAMHITTDPIMKPRQNWQQSAIQKSLGPHKSMKKNQRVLRFGSKQRGLHTVTM